jgi:hypothetical protein
MKGCFSHLAASLFVSFVPSRVSSPSTRLPVSLPHF